MDVMPWLNRFRVLLQKKEPAVYQVERTMGVMPLLNRFRVFLPKKGASCVQSGIFRSDRLQLQIEG